MVTWHSIAGDCTGSGAGNLGWSLVCAIRTYETLGRWRGFSEPQFSYLQNEDNNSIFCKASFVLSE